MRSLQIILGIERANCHKGMSKNLDGKAMGKVQKVDQFQNTIKEEGSDLRQEAEETKGGIESKFEDMEAKLKAGEKTMSTKIGDSSRLGQ